MGGNSLVVRFDDTAATQHALVGGKAASLGRLVRAGFSRARGIFDLDRRLLRLHVRLAGAGGEHPRHR